MATASLLGEDGHGYHLALRLESCGAWRAWLGDAPYAAFAHNLASPAAWDAFMSPSPSPPHLHLQLRVRALLFDKASAALSINAGGTVPSLDELNPNYLQLHGDDIYYSLEDCQQDGVRNEDAKKILYVVHLKATNIKTYNQNLLLASLITNVEEVLWDEDNGLKEGFNLPAQMKATFSTYERASNVGSKYHEPDNINTLPRHRLEDLPETWYSQFLREYRMRHHTFPYCDKEPQKRTSEGMSMFLKLCDKHKRKRQAFEEGQNVSIRDPVVENGSVHSKIASDITNLTEEEFTFFPEMMFPSNCVPDSAIPPSNDMGKRRKIEVSEVLDNLPTIISRSAAMIERFGIIPEYHKMGGKYRGKDSSAGEKKPLGAEQASKMTRKVIASTLARVGFEGGSEFSMEVFSEILGTRICKFGRILKLLSDSYKKQFSSIELLKMFLQATGCNLANLSEFIKDGNKGFTQQPHQNVRVMQPQQQNLLLQAQYQRQVQHMQQMQLLHPQNLAFQQQQLQQQQLLRRHQMSNPRGSMVIIDKDQQSMVDVKLENVMESPIERVLSTFDKQQLQLRQQMAMSSQHAQSGQQFKQMSNVQIPPLQAQSAYGMRTQPVKMEAFRDLRGADSTVKHESDQNKLTSPPQ